MDIQTAFTNIQNACHNVLGNLQDHLNLQESLKEIKALIEKAQKPLPDEPSK